VARVRAYTSSVDGEASGAWESYTRGVLSVKH
jgi:hypothetical protein